jgi:hypothetical protein
MGRRSWLALPLLCTVCQMETPHVDLYDPPESPEEMGPLEAEIGYVLEPVALDPGADQLRCVSLTLQNEAPLYVQAVRSVNEGAFHHGNWFVVPDSVYPGDDGWWDCEDRGFDEIEAAMAGTVLFAQSTQARSEEQRFADGVVVKIPRHSKIVADVHLLNTTARSLSTREWLYFDLVHPLLVTTTLSPIVLGYYDLWIPAGQRTRHTGRCLHNDEQPWSQMTLHYVLPHFHAFGDFFSLTVVDEFGAPTWTNEIEGFGAAGLGTIVDPPVEVDRDGGVTFTCGYDNWLSTDLEWGLGSGEMCVVLALVDADVLLVGGVRDGRMVVSVEDDTHSYEGECEWATSPLPSVYRDTFGEPGILYIPPGADPADLPEPPTCRDADPSADPIAAPTLDALRTHVFEPSCTFSACHGEARAGGLDLRSANLRAELLDHEMQRDTPLPLVAPGDPDGSYLLRVLARCDPGNGTSPMPVNAPTLLDDEMVALVRAWIAADAPG